jgi:hypothetical protein
MDDRTLWMIVGAVFMAYGAWWMVVGIRRAIRERRAKRHAK